MPNPLDPRKKKNKNNEFDTFVITDEDDNILVVNPFTAINPSGISTSALAFEIETFSKNFSKLVEESDPHEYNLKIKKAKLILEEETNV